MFGRGNLRGNGGGADEYDVGSLGSKRQRLLDPPYYSPGQGSLYGGGNFAESYLSQPKAFPVVRLRGLPFNCSEADVFDFFAGLDVVDVLLVCKNGRFSGDAYVVLGTILQVDLALQRNHQNIGRRYIEVFRSKKMEYYHAVAAELEDANSEDLPQPQVRPPRKSPDNDQPVEHTGVLRLRGLPFATSKLEIIEFFKEYGLKEVNIHIVTHSDGRATGEAYVEFASPSDSQSAMGKDKMTIGNRYVELFPSSREEAAKAASRARSG